MVLLKISLKNLVRNRRRTVATLVSIVFGASIMVFANGYNDGFASQWARSLIDETQGHLVVRHKEFQKYERTDLEKIYINDAPSLMAEIKEVPGVVDVMPRVITGGLISKGEKSSIFVSWFNDLDKIDATLPGHGLSVISGYPLSKNDPDGVVLGEKLARNMGAEIGDELVLMTNSIYGDRNAILVHVAGIKAFSTNSEMEGNFMTAGFSEQVREYLLEIGEGATELVVRLDNESQLEQVVNTLNDRFAKDSRPWVARPWHAEEAFQTVTSMYKGMGFLIMVILSILVGFVVSNSMMISIYERTREVGTMRAVGLRKKLVYLMSYYEFMLVMLAGSAVGVLLGCLFVVIGGYTGVSISSDVQVVYPIIEMGNLLVSFVVPFIIASLFVVFTIRSGNKVEITDMLR